MSLDSLFFIERKSNSGYVLVKSFLYDFRDYKLYASLVGNFASHSNLETKMRISKIEEYPDNLSQETQSYIKDDQCGYCSIDVVEVLKVDWSDYNSFNENLISYLKNLEAAENYRLVIVFV